MLTVVEDSEIKSPGEVGPGALAEWQTPPATLTLLVLDNSQVIATLDDAVSKSGPNLKPWNFSQAAAQTHIPGMLDALKKFRESQTAYWRSIGPNVRCELVNFWPITQWDEEHRVTADPVGQKMWTEQVSVDKNLWDLAKSAFLLYHMVFPPETWLRRTLDNLEPGSMIDITWLAKCGDHVANVPWALMYRSDPKRDQPVSATQFWGLRYRLDYQTYETRLSPRSRALGDPKATSSRLGHAYYWKGSEKDLAFQEANWQRKCLEDFPAHFALPDAEEPNPKDRLIHWLEKPRPNPMPVLYLYCKARVRDRCYLEFGQDNLNRDSVTIRDLDLPITQFEDVQFVFCNACESGMRQGAQAANLLELHFFTRGCTAFLGTIHETPIELASRFAIVFFHFFYGRVGGKAVSAGEAVVQARRFLWLKYRNVGGLFYNYVNEYELYLADEMELSE